MVREGSRVMVVQFDKDYNGSLGKIVREYTSNTLAFDVSLDVADWRIGTVCCTRQQVVPIPQNATSIQLEALKAIYG